MSRYPRGIAVGFVVALGIGLVACDSEQLAVTPPPPPPPPPPPAGYTLSGVVYEHTGNGQLPRHNVKLRVHVYASNAFIDVTSDELGRYALSGVAAGAVSISAAAGSGYYAPCPAGSDVFPSTRQFDVHVVSATRLLDAGTPTDFPFASIWVSGVVYERTDQGRKTIAGATVTLGESDATDPRLGSTTLSDATGYYRVCPQIPSTGTDTYGTIRVSREGYETAISRAFLGWDYEGVDIELVRK